MKAFAVASEPYIFWRGESAKEVIDRINVPVGVGRLEPAEDKFNGPSGKALDERVLTPLGLKREHAWLCDLVPYSCRNIGQTAAIERYKPFVASHGLPDPSVPQVPPALADDARRQEILSELEESKAGVLILLGDKPIWWFLRHFMPEWQKLSDFKPYGQLRDCKINGKTYRVLPLVHPRQAARLGTSTEKWFDAHQQWMRETANSVLA